MRRTSPIRNRLRPYNESGAFNSLVNVHWFPTANSFCTKAGGVGAVARIRGVDAECLGLEQLSTATAAIRSAQWALDQGFTIRQYLLKRERLGSPPPAYGNAVVDRAVRNRFQYL